MRRLFVLSWLHSICSGFLWSSCPCNSRTRLFRQESRTRSFHKNIPPSPSRQTLSSTRTPSCFWSVAPRTQDSNDDPSTADLSEEKQAEVLLSLIEECDSKTSDLEGTTEKSIENIMISLESSGAKQDAEVDLCPPSAFTPLLGNYDVSYVVPFEKGDSPAGGKWTRKTGIAPLLVRSRKTFQHLLTAGSSGFESAIPSNKGNSVAEAVNVVSLAALAGLVRITVILRGDAVALGREERLAVTKEKQTPGGLSPKTVRVYFDPPRIIFGKVGRILNLNLGPRTSVVLDSPYYKGNIRLGKGSNGSRFVFTRCSPKEKEADDWRAMLQRKPMSRVKALVFLSAVFLSGASSALKGSRVLGTVVSSFSLFAAAIVSFSSGGIVRRDD